MKRSTQRILTTHVGSLPRPPDLLEMIRAREQGQPVDGAVFANRVKSAVAEAVRKQADSGIDIVADGEMGRFGFIPYVNERLAGLEPRNTGGRGANWAQSREYLAFPEYYQWFSQMPGAAGRAPPTQWVCTGPIFYRGKEALQRDIDNLKAALAEVSSEEAFMPASPRPTSPIGTPTSITKPTRSSASPLPTRCTRSTGRSSMPGSCCRSTIRSWPAIGR
jgi:5-methyltetrahydropteroyltriglutamate--homocysteine methyltransferase